MNEHPPPKMLVALACLTMLAVASTSFFFGRGCESCARRPYTPELVGIDAGPGEREIGERLDAALQQVEARIDEIEREHARELAAFNEMQRRKYEALREDPEAADEFIRAFTRRLRDAQ